jgi:Brp/Blh family beta-carotene 15,15'-monooxygenase
MDVVVLGLTAAMGVLELTLPAWYASVRFQLVALLALGGVIHGTLDDWIAERIIPDTGRRFYLGYLAAMGLMAVAWWASPTGALALFLLMSAYHFGESELADLRIGQSSHFAFLSRGALIVGVPLCLHFEEVTPILAAADATLPTVGVTSRAMLAGLLITQHIVLLWRVVPRGSAYRELVRMLVLVPLLLIASPLVSFAVYFTLWHAPVHLITMRQVLAPGIPWTMLARRAAPIAAISIAGALLLWALIRHTSPATQWAALFVGLGALTLPHSALVSLTFRRHLAPDEGPG